MEANRTWVTALVTAYARAYHATHDSPLIFDDYLADQLYTPEEHQQFDHNLAGQVTLLDPELISGRFDQTEALAAVMHLMHCPVTLSRFRYAEDSLRASMALGVRQYINLGAGFDTFAFRLPSWASQLKILEFDHPVTQVMKRERVKQAGWEVPAQLYFVPVDFSKETLAEAIRRSPYDSGHISFFSWLGVSYYLSAEVITDTLQSIVTLAPRGSELVFDYMDTDSFDPRRAARRTQLMHKIAAQVGEPMKTGFEPATLATELGALGFTLQDNLSPDAIEARYFVGRNDNLHAFEHVHFARASVA